MFLPVTDELLADTPRFSSFISATLSLGLMRKFTVEQFDEDWNDVARETDLLEHGRSNTWDPRYWPDEFDCY